MPLLFGLRPRLPWLEVVLQPDGCWTATGKRNSCGYPCRYDSRSRVGAATSRIAMSQVVGRPLQRHEWALHRCDNPACVRPSHLYIGDAKQNVADMHARGRAHSVAGSRHGQAKLTEETVRLAREAVAAGATVLSQAQRYGVSRPTMHRAVKGGGWRHVPRPEIDGRSLREGGVGF